MNQKKWKIGFGLTTDVDYGKDLPELDAVEFKTIVSKKGQKSITGFEITVESATKEEATERASWKASNLTGLLATLSCKAVLYRLSSVFEQKFDDGGGTLSKSIICKYEISQNIDLNRVPKGKLSSLIEGADMKLRQKMSYLNQALNSIKGEDYASAIRYLYLIVEDDGKLKNLKEKYEPLRHILSHSLTYPDDVKTFEEANFIFIGKRPHGHAQFDHASETNKCNLRTEAKNFITEIKAEIKNEIENC